MDRKLNGRCWHGVDMMEHCERCASKDEVAAKTANNKQSTPCLHEKWFRYSEKLQNTCMDCGKKF